LGVFLILEYPGELKGESEGLRIGASKTCNQAGKGGWVVGEVILEKGTKRRQKKTCGAKREWGNKKASWKGS